MADLTTLQQSIDGLGDLVGKAVTQINDLRQQVSDLQGGGGAMDVQPLQDRVESLTEDLSGVLNASGTEPTPGPAPTPPEPTPPEPTRAAAPRAAGAGTIHQQAAKIAGRRNV